MAIGRFYETGEQHDLNHRLFEPIADKVSEEQKVRRSVN